MIQKLNQDHSKKPGNNVMQTPLIKEGSNLRFLYKSQYL